MDQDGVFDHEQPRLNGRTSHRAAVMRPVSRCSPTASTKGSNTMQSNQAQILEQLRAAFPATPIHAKGAFDDWGTTYLDAATYLERIDGKTWQELDRAYLVTRSDALGFLGARHLVAVLPVYLSSLIEEGVWSPSADTLMVLLAKPGPEKRAGLKLDRFDALVAALTPAQRAAIASVLSAFAAIDREGSLGQAAYAAVEKHWKDYLLEGS
jgi:hypothetical protein